MRPKVAAMRTHFSVTARILFFYIFAGLLLQKSVSRMLAQYIFLFLLSVMGQLMRECARIAANAWESGPDCDSVNSLTVNAVLAQNINS